MDNTIRQLERSKDIRYYQALQRAGRLSDADLYLLAYCGEPTQELLPCSWCRENYQNAPVVIPPLVDCPLCESRLPKEWFEADWLPGLNYMFINHIFEKTKEWEWGDKCTQLQRTAAVALAKLEDKWLDNEPCPVDEPGSTRENCPWHRHQEDLKRYISVIETWLATPTKENFDAAWNLEVSLYLPYAAAPQWRIMEEPWEYLKWACAEKQDYASSVEKKAAICKALVERLCR